MPPWTLVTTSLLLLLTTTALSQAARHTIRHDREHHEDENYIGGVAYEGGKKFFAVMKQENQFPLTDDGLIEVPDGVKRVWIDVGSDYSSLGGVCGPCERSWWPGRPALKDEVKTATDLLVIAIDANPDFMPQLRQLPRHLALNAALWTNEKTKAFYDYAAWGCSSILEPRKDFDDDAMTGVWHARDQCRNIVRSHGVSVFRLETILNLVPRNITIELLKVDAQGADLQIVQSAGKELRRIEKVIMEVQEVTGKATELRLYQDQPSAEDAKVWMQGQGYAFDAERSYVENGLLGEANYGFTRV